MFWPARSESPVSEAATRTVEIINKRGLHARASAKFVKTASGFESEVRVSKDGQTVDARSIMGLMMLAAGPGCCIDIEAEGADAEAAVQALEQLVSAKFDEEEYPSRPAARERKGVQVFSRQPVRKIQVTAPRHSPRKTSVIPRLAPTPTSEIP